MIVISNTHILNLNFFKIYLAYINKISDLKASLLWLRNKKKALPEANNQYDGKQGDVACALTQAIAL